MATHLERERQEQVLISAFEERDTIKAKLKSAPGITGQLKSWHAVLGETVFHFQPDNTWSALILGADEFELAEPVTA